MNLKNRRRYNIILIAVGLASWILAIVFGGENEKSVFISSFGTAIAAIGIIKTIKLKRILRDSEKAADFEAMQKDERTVFIANKARSMALYISILVQCIVSIIAYYVFDNLLVCQVLSFTTCFQCLLYYAFWIIYNKKY